ncbi:hypothetical protein F925_01767 [Acinetobacter lwoffii NCTC 5866 = CIP 64.10 = NIPH 512]|nr:hypothetical protein F925_01767 [Acinetobacter lwoffii NCTC 5866 = CIP 64.10 = NIPH 512]
MVFRANEISQESRINAKRYLLSNLKDLPESDRQNSRQYLENIMDELGAVVDGYPIWHPLIVDKSKWMFYTRPHRDAGYAKLDHTVFFVNGFITCPYNEASNYGQDVIDAINAIPPTHGVHITAEKIPVTLYNLGTTSILVRCIWPEASSNDQSLSLSAIMPKLLSTAVKINEMGETSFSLEEMLPYLLGQPHGKRSSLFVNQATGLAIKKMWQNILNSEMI